MKYQGWEYQPEDEDYGDCIKTWHWIITPEGAQVALDRHTSEWNQISPYSAPSREQFEREVQHLKMLEFFKVDKLTN